MCLLELAERGAKIYADTVAHMAAINAPPKMRPPFFSDSRYPGGTCAETGV
jgi:hypothetical protein